MADLVESWPDPRIVNLQQRIATLENALVEALDGWHSHQESRDDQAQHCDEDRIAELRKLLGGAE